MSRETRLRRLRLERERSGKSALILKGPELAFDRETAIRDLKFTAMTLKNIGPNSTVVEHYPEGWSKLDALLESMGQLARLTGRPLDVTLAWMTDAAVATGHPLAPDLATLVAEGELA